MRAFSLPEQKVTKLTKSALRSGAWLASRCAYDDSRCPWDDSVENADACRIPSGFAPGSGDDAHPATGLRDPAASLAAWAYGPGRSSARHWRARPRGQFFSALWRSQSLSAAASPHADPRGDRRSPNIRGSARGGPATGPRVRGQAVSRTARRTSRPRSAASATHPRGADRRCAARRTNRTPRGDPPCIPSPLCKCDCRWPWSA